MQDGKVQDGKAGWNEEVEVRQVQDMEGAG